MSQTRTFIALPLPVEVREQAAELIDEWKRLGGQVRWVAVENLHLTLQFLGDVITNELHEVCRAVTRTSAAHAPFTLRIEGAGAFPDIRRARTLWLGVGGEREPLTALQQDLSDALEELGYRPEARAYHPHLTVGRVRSVSPAERAALTEAVTAAAAFDAGPAPIQEVVVFASYLQKGGPEHERLATCPLGETNPAG